MIPNVQAQGNFGTPTNQDHLFLQQQQPQQFHHPQQQQTQQQFQPQQQQQEMQFQQFQQQQQFIQQQQFHHQQHRLLHSPQQPQSSLQSPPPQQTVVHTPQSMMHTPQQQQQLVHTPQQSVQTPQQHQSLASHFHLYPVSSKPNYPVFMGIIVCVCLMSVIGSWWRNYQMQLKLEHEIRTLMPWFVLLSLGNILSRVLGC